MISRFSKEDLLVGKVGVRTLRYMQNYVRLFRAARVLLGWSQDELADRAGVGRTTLYKLEGGSTDVRFQTVVAVQKVLEEGGIEFVPGDDTHGPGLRVRKGVFEDDSEGR